MVADSGYDYDARLRRLQLRRPDYQTMVPQLLKLINERSKKATGSKEAWTKAKELIPEMKNIYDELFAPGTRCAF